MKTEPSQPSDSTPSAPANRASRSRSTDWYSEGQGCVVRIGNEYVVFKVLGRKGRRARVQIEAPAGAEFDSH